MIGAVEVLETLVVDLPNAQRLRDHSIPQKSSVYWVVPKMGSTSLHTQQELSQVVAYADEYYAAYTEQEINELFINQFGDVPEVSFTTGGYELTFRFRGEYYGAYHKSSLLAKVNMLLKYWKIFTEPKLPL